MGVITLYVRWKLCLLSPKYHFRHQEKHIESPHDKGSTLTNKHNEWMRGGPQATQIQWKTMTNEYLKMRIVFEVTIHSNYYVQQAIVSETMKFGTSMQHLIIEDLYIG